MVGDNRLRGKEAVRKWMVEVYAKPPRFKVQSLIAEADLVVAIGEIDLEDSEGKTITSSYCDVWRFERGRMVELRAFAIPAHAPV